MAVQLPTRLSRVLIRASNSCSPTRLLCRGPKVEPAQPTVPVGLGLWMVRSSRIRFCSHPAEHKADTFQKKNNKKSHPDLEIAATSFRLEFSFSSFPAVMDQRPCRITAVSLQHPGKASNCRAVQKYQEKNHCPGITRVPLQFCTPADSLCCCHTPTHISTVCACYLDLAGSLDVVDGVESLLYRLPQSHNAVIPQHQNLHVKEINIYTGTKPTFVRFSMAAGEWSSKQRLIWSHITSPLFFISW